MPKSPTVVVLIFMTGLGMLVFLIWPSFLKLNTAYIELEEQKILMVYQQEKIADLIAASQERENYGLEIRKIESAFPDGYDFPSLFHFLNGASRGYGLRMDITSFSAKPHERGLNEIEINLSLTGSYFGFRNFLDRLEKSSRIFSIENVYAQAERREEAEEMRFDLKIKTYSK